MKKFKLVVLLILALFVNSGCIGTIIVATVLIKKKRARARAAQQQTVIEAQIKEEPTEKGQDNE